MVIEMLRKYLFIKLTSGPCRRFMRRRVVKTHRNNVKTPLRLAEKGVDAFDLSEFWRMKRWIWRPEEAVCRG